MKIAFFGTSDRSIPIINALADNFNLVLCVTKADTNVGRKQTVRETAVKKWAQEHRVDYVEIKNINDSRGVIIENLLEHGIDLGVVADFSFIIPKEILEKPKYGLVNIHFSLLPKLRGASPVQHAILQGLEKTGITYFIMDERMDTGKVLEQIEYHLQGNETSDELYTALFKQAAQHLPEVLHQYTNGKLKPKKQDGQQATYCYSKSKPKLTTIQKDDARIDWQNEIPIIERCIRAYTPWPIAWTTLGELENNPKLSVPITLKEDVNRRLRVKIYQAGISEDKLFILNLQVEGKKITDWKSFINGYAVV